MPWYEIIVDVAGLTRDVLPRGNKEGAERAVQELKARWPEADLIYVRQHQKGGKFRVLHKLTWKRGAA